MDMAEAFMAYGNGQTPFSGYTGAIKEAQKANPEVFQDIMDRNTDDKIKMLNAIQFGTDDMRGTNDTLNRAVERAPYLAVPPIGFESFTLPSPENAQTYGSVVRSRGEGSPPERMYLPGSLVNSERMGTRTSFPSVLKHEITHLGGATEPQARALQEHFGGRKTLSKEQINNMAPTMDARRGAQTQRFNLGD